MITAEELGGLDNAYAIAANYDGGFIHLLIVNGNAIHSFRMDNYLSKPIEVDVYTLPFELLAKPIVQS